MSNRKHTDDLKREFHEAYELYADALFRYSYYKLSDREKAKDVVQDTFVKFWEYIASDGNVENKKAFLYRIATNAVVDNYRKRKDVSLDFMAEEGFDPADAESHKQMVRDADSSLALKLVNELGERDRDIILLRYIDGLSVKEIAEVFGERENTISVKIHRAIKDLQSLFEKHDR